MHAHLKPLSKPKMRWHHTRALFWAMARWPPYTSEMSMTAGHTELQTGAASRVAHRSMRHWPLQGGLKAHLAAFFNKALACSTWERVMSRSPAFWLNLHSQAPGG